MISAVAARSASTGPESKQPEAMAKMEIGAPNVLRGTVSDLRKDSAVAQIQVDIGGGNIVTSTITADSAQRLALAVGKEISVIIKASDVMVGIDD